MNDISAAPPPGRAGIKLIPGVTLVPIPQSAASPQEVPAHLLAAVKQQWKRYRRELKRCQIQFSERAVHQSRVETRRLLSLVELLGTCLPADHIERIQVCLKRHLDTFDDLRDVHVQLLLMSKLRNGHPEAKIFERHLRKREKRLDRRTRKSIKRIKTRRLGRLIAVCREDLRALATAPAAPRFSHSSSPRRAKSAQASPPHEVLLRAVDSAFDRVTELENRIEPARTKTIHVTRVAFKKFRYMVEMLAGFLVDANARQLAALRQYQTLMGDIQDLEVLLRAHEKFARKKLMRPASAAGFRDQLLHRKQQLVARYLSKADRLYSFWPRHRSLPRNDRAKAPRRLAAGAPTNPAKPARTGAR